MMSVQSFSTSGLSSQYLEVVRVTYCCCEEESLSSSCRASFCSRAGLIGLVDGFIMPCCGREAAVGPLRGGDNGGGSVDG